MDIQSFIPYTHYSRGVSVRKEETPHANCTLMQLIKMVRGARVAAGSIKEKTAQLT
jgi:hypothetical protein